MANTREIQERINSIQDTRKITNAMYLISSTKLQKARKNLEDTEPFFFNMEAMIAKMLRHLPELEYRYFEMDETRTFSQRRQGYIVITADKGMAGAYNHNVLKLAEQQLQSNEKFRLFVVGEAGRQYFTGKGIPIDEHFKHTAQDPHLGRARTITGKILAAYDAHEIDEAYILYTRMIRGLVVEPQMERLLPLYRSDFSGSQLMGVYHEEYTFEPSVEAVLDNCVPNYICGFVYSALVESFCCEQHERMQAMQAANESSSEMLRELSIDYNRVRQAQITQQITEVIGGAKAQKRKKAQREKKGLL